MSKSKKRWAQEEKNFLRENIGKMPYKEIARHLCRTVQSVEYKVHDMKLTWKKKWTEEEVKFLKENVGKMSYEDMGRVLGRTEQSISGKCYTLGIHAGCKKRALYYRNGWTEEEKDFLRKNIRQLSYEEIGKKLGRTKAAVDGMAQKLNITVNKGWKDEEILFLRENVHQMSLKEVAKSMGRTEQSIYQMSSKLKLEVFKRWTKEEEDVVLAQYKLGGTVEVSKTIDRSIVSIRHRAKKLNLKANYEFVNKKNRLDEDYFRIPTIENCYWAGLIGADGCIFGNRIAISLVEDDKYILEKFKEAMSFTGPLLFKPKQKITHKNQCSVNMYSSQCVKDLLLHWNITPNKANTLQSPEDYINRDLALSYIIGNFDGDGSAYYCSKNKKNITYTMKFCGTKPMMEWIAYHLDLALPRQNKSRSNYIYFVNNYTHELRYGGKYALLLRDKLLEVPTGCILRRKWYDKEMKSYNRMIQKYADSAM